MKFSKAAYNYQKKAVKFLQKNPHSGLFLDMGLGKTAITLNYINQSDIKRVLIIAPLRVIYNVWPQELYKWEDFKHLSCSIVHGPKKLEALHKEADIYLINPEGLKWLVEQDAPRFDTLIIDESTKFKTWTSKRMKLLKSMLPLFKRRHILTGTPAPNSLQDLFSQIYICDEGKTLGKFITHFRSEYFYQIAIPGSKAFLYNVIPGKDKEIYKKVSKLTLRMDSKDYLELPKKIMNNVFLKFDPKTRKIYKSMEEELFIELEKEKSVYAMTVTDALLKCRQIISGAIYDDYDRKTFTTLHDIKMDALKDIIAEQQGNPLLVVYDFRHELERFKNEFGEIRYIGGGAKHVEETVMLWNAGKLPLLFVHPKSAGHGLNLQAGGNHIVWYSLTWSMDEYDQMNARLLRQGQEKPVYIHRLIIKDSIDVYMGKKLAAKKMQQDDLFDYLKNSQS